MHASSRFRSAEGEPKDRAFAFVHGSRSPRQFLAFFAVIPIYFIY